MDRADAKLQSQLLNSLFGDPEQEAVTPIADGVTN